MLAEDERACNSYISRYEWDSRPTRGPTRRLPRDVNAVIIHHTEGRRCFNFEECRRLLHHMQRYYQREKEFPDIPWNFMIGEDGAVYEGMGWNLEGYHTEAWNYRSIGIAFIGTFDRERPSRQAMESFNLLVECGRRHRYLDRYFSIYGHRDMRDTECPGDALYDVIRRLGSFKLVEPDLIGLRSMNNDLAALNATSLDHLSKDNKNE